MLDKKDNTFKHIVIGLLTFLSVYFAISLYNNRNTYSEEIKSLQQEKEVLEKQLKNRVEIDSILSICNELDSLQELLVDKFKEMENEKVNIDLHTISIDSNIVILSKYLSEKDSVK